MLEIELNCNTYKVCTIYLLTCHVAIYLPHGINGMAMTWKLAPSPFLSLSRNCWNKKIASRQRKHAKSLFFFFLLFIPSRSIDSQQINYFCVTLHKVKRQNKTTREMPGMVVVGGFSAETRRNAPVWKEHSFTGSPLESCQTDKQGGGRESVFFFLNVIH